MTKRNAFYAALNTAAHETLDSLLQEARERGFTMGEESERSEIYGVVHASFEVELRGDLVADAYVRFNFVDPNAMRVTYEVAHPVRGAMRASRKISFSAYASDVRSSLQTLAQSMAEGCR